VVEEPLFQQYAIGIRDFLEGCDISGFNVINFDLPCLEAEFTRSNVDFSRKSRYLIDSMVIFHQREPRNLKAAYLKYCGKEMGNAHSAKEDAKVSSEILDSQLDMYQDLPRDVAGLSALCYKIDANNIDVDGKFIWVEREAVCDFGKKHVGRKLRDIAIQDPSYLEWITGSDFSKEVKDIAINALKGEFPEK